MSGTKTLNRREFLSEVSVTAGARGPVALMVPTIALIPRFEAPGSGTESGTPAG